MLKKNARDKQWDTLKKVFCYIKKYRGYLILSILGLSIVSYALIQNELNNLATA